MRKIRFSDLNWFLKLAVIFAWIEGMIMIVSFLVGFIVGLLGI